jgi:hypothetical protein
MSPKHILLKLGGLSTAIWAIAADGAIGIWIVCGLIVLGFGLIAVLALTGTYAGEERREAAQTVLAILLGRDHPGSADSASRRKLVVSAKPPGTSHGSHSGSAA